jgi:hypothetical protein
MGQQMKRRFIRFALPLLLAFVGILGGVGWFRSSPDPTRFGQSMAFGVAGIFSDADFETFIGIRDTYIRLELEQARSSLLGKEIHYPIVQTLVLKRAGPTPKFLAGSEELRDRGMSVVNPSLESQMQLFPVITWDSQRDFIRDNAEQVLATGVPVRSWVFVPQNLQYYVSKIGCISAFSALVLVVTARVLHAARTSWLKNSRVRRNLCTRCGYPRDPLVGPVCPECGGSEAGREGATP